MSTSAKRWDILICSAICIVLGVAAGGIAFRGHAEKSEAPSANAHAVHGEQDGHAGHTHEEDRPTLSPKTLKNLGVEIAEIKAGTFFRKHDVPAVIAETPASDQPVYAPIGGRVQEIMIGQGTVVEAGETLVTLIRDPIPRPTLGLTQEVLNPAKEEIHQTVIELRKAREEIRINETELARIQKYTNKGKDGDLPILPTKTLIDLRYQLTRARKTHELSRMLLTNHGFNNAQIDLLMKGEAVPRLDHEIWRRALSKNGLWPGQAQSLHGTLDPKISAKPWVVATIAELTAADLNSDELIQWLKQDTSAQARFLEIASMLQQGHSVADLKRLHKMNAFDPIVKVSVPDNRSVPDYDVHEIMVKRGAKVEAGAALLILSNPRKLYLKTESVGGEKTDVLRAVEKGLHCDATPLVKGSGPTLSDLHVCFVTNARNASGTVGFIEVRNAMLAEHKDEDGRRHRTWKLRPGLKYTLRIPSQKLKNVYVLPSDAVTEDGPNKVVFVQDGDSFRTVVVEIAYQDHEFAVIPINKRTTLFPGDPVVVRGAFPLGLALKGGTHEVDPHAGHSH